MLLGPQSGHSGHASEALLPRTYAPVRMSRYTAPAVAAYSTRGMTRRRSGAKAQTARSVSAARSASAVARCAVTQTTTPTTTRTNVQPSERSARTRKRRALARASAMARGEGGLLQRTSAVHDGHDVEVVRRGRRARGPLEGVAVPGIRRRATAR